MPSVGDVPPDPAPPAVLRFDRPARTWLECLPLGNGSVGAMLDGGVPEGRLRLNHEHGWSGSPGSERQASVPADIAAAALARARRALADGRPADAEGHLARMQGRYSQAFLPMGECVLRCAAAPDGGYERSLDLATGVHEVRAGEVRQRVVASAPLGVLAVETTCPVEVALDTPLAVVDRRESGDERVLLVRWPSDVPPVHEQDYPAATWDPTPGAALEGVVLARTRPAPDGGSLVVLALETTFPGLGRTGGGRVEDAVERARARVAHACVLPVDEVFAQAAQDHGRLFGRSRVETASPVEPDRDLGRRLEAAFSSGTHPWAADPGLAGLLYDVGRYLLVASAREGGLPPTLQGIWNAQMRPPWSSNYTLNINAQMNHWACHPTSLSETAEPLLALVEALAVAGRETARRLYDAPGWCVHHNTDQWLFSSPVGEGHGQARWSSWPMAAPWLVVQLWSAVEFGAGHPQRLWPLARGAAEFLLAWHHEVGDGRWVTAPATSPENVYRGPDGAVVAVDETTALDQQLVHALFRVVADLAERLGLQDDDVAVRSRARTVTLSPQPAVAADGTLQEWAGEREEVEPGHRHVSHLWGVYPGWGGWDEAGLAAAVATLERRGDDSSGWSLVWKMCLWARLGRGDKVSDLARLLFRHVPTDQGPEAGGLYPNLFAAHPPFQIDANLGFPAALAEALVQSHDDIHLLPALPSELADGRASGLTARPGVRVDLEWRGGRLVQVRLRAERPTRVRVRYDGAARTLDLGSEGAVLRAEDFDVDGRPASRRSSP